MATGQQAGLCDFYHTNTHQGHAHHKCFLQTAFTFCLVNLNRRDAVSTLAETTGSKSRARRPVAPTWEATAASTFTPAQSECSQRVLLPAFGRETRFESRWTFHRKIGQQIQERSLHDGLSRVTLGVTRHGAAPFASQGLNMYVKQTGTSELPECGRKMARLSTGSSRRLTVRTGEDVKLSVSQSVSSRSPRAHHVSVP